MRRFFIEKENIQDDRAKIVGEEVEHMRRVLRLKPGNHIAVFDGAGREHEAIIVGFGKDFAELRVVKSYQPQRESTLELTVALGLMKGDKMDFVVEKATEFGVKAIAPFSSKYTVPNLDEQKIARRTERWKKIALAAAKQCGRTSVPEIIMLSDFRAVITRETAATLKILFWEREQEHSLIQLHARYSNARSILLVTGPEGGFSEDEAVEARENGFHLVKLGPRTLRAETAALAAMSFAQLLWGDMG